MINFLTLSLKFPKSFKAVNALDHQVMNSLLVGFIMCQAVDGCDAKVGYR